MPQQPKATLTKTASATLGRDITQKTHYSNKHLKGRHAPQSSTTKTDDYSKAMKRTTSSIHRNIEEVMAARLIHDGGRLSILPAPTNVHEYAKGGAKQNTKNHLVSSSINAARRSRMKKDAAISGIAAGSDNKSSAVLNQAPKTKKITKADRHRQQLLEAAEAEEREKAQATSAPISTPTAPTSTSTSTSTSKRKRKSAPSITLEGEALKRERKRLKYIREMQGEVVSSSDEEHDDDDDQDEDEDEDDQDDAHEEKENHKENTKHTMDSANTVHTATSSSTMTTSTSASTSSSSSTSLSLSSSSSAPSTSKR